MVAPMMNIRQTYLVDTTFFLRQTADVFYGAPLLVADGKDHTFAYGFLRDLLKNPLTKLNRSTSKELTNNLFQLRLVLNTTFTLS